MTYTNFSIPPLTQLLKEKKVNFTKFIEILNSGSNQLISEKVKLEPTIQEIAH